MTNFNCHEKADEELMLAFQEHKNNFALETLIRRHQTTIMRFCMNRVGKRDGEDVCQQVFMSMIQSRYHLGRGEFICWLFGIALNCCRKHLRKKATTRRQLDRLSRQHTAETINGDSSMNDEPLKDELTEAATRTFQALPDKYRLALELQIFQGLSLEQIGAVIGTSRSSAQRLTEKAKELLRKRLSGLGYTGVNAGVIFAALKSSFERQPLTSFDLTDKILAAYHGGSVVGAGGESVRVAQTAVIWKTSLAVVGLVAAGLIAAYVWSEPELSENEIAGGSNSTIAEIKESSPAKNEALQPLLKIVEGEGRFLSQAGPNGEECLEVENGATVLIDRPIQKFPVFISYKYRVFYQPHLEREYRTLIVGKNSLYCVLFHNLHAPTFLSPGSEVWLEERLYIAADHTIGIRKNDIFHLTMEERDPTDNRLVIMTRGKHRLANFVIQEEIPPTVKIPDVGAYLEAVRNIPEEQRRDRETVPLPTLRGHDPQKPVSVSFFYAKAVPPKADAQP